MFCKKCGKEFVDGSKYCDRCGYPTDNITVSSSTPNTKAETNNEDAGNKCLPAFILGLIASIFGMFGGFCMTMCTGMMCMDSASNFAFFFIFCGSILGLVGACLCLNKALLGSILQLVAALFIIIYAYGMVGAEFMTILAMLLFLAGGIVGIIFYFIKRK